MVAAIGLLLISGLATGAPVKGQAPDQKQSGIIVLKSNWKKGVRGPDLGRPIFDQSRPGRNPDLNLDDPFQRMRQAQRQMTMRVDGYYYSATFKNIGSKPVKAVAWDYTVASPGDPKSLTHHQFHARIDIGPGKRKELYRFSVAPPTRTVAAGKGDARPIEEVVLTAVQYKDGSVWRLQQ